MTDMTTAELERRGFEYVERYEAALPVAEWSLDLEVERERDLSAAESTVLALVQDGTDDIGGLTLLLGLGEDVRLAERILVDLLRSSAIEPAGEGFGITDLGERWLAHRTARVRQRFTVAVRLDPLTDKFDWIDHETPAHGNDDVWTIELPAVDDDHLLYRKAEIGELVRTEGIPFKDGSQADDHLRGIELFGVTVLERRRHWRRVEFEVWRHPARVEERLVGYIGEAENPRFSSVLAQLRLVRERMRLVAQR